MDSGSLVGAFFLRSLGMTSPRIKCLLSEDKMNSEIIAAFRAGGKAQGETGK